MMKGRLLTPRQPTALFAAIFWIALMMLAPSLMMKDPGIFWHTVVGEHMLQTHEAVTTDSFTFTQIGQPWLAQQWLGEMAMACAHRIGRLDSIVTLAVSIIATVFTIIFWNARRRGMATTDALLITILTIAASSYHFIPRPHLFTILGITVLMLVLSRIESSKYSSATVFVLPPLFLFWVNTHGGALGGIATFMLFCLCWLVQPYVSWLRSPATPATLPERQRQTVLLGIALSGVLVAPLVNPFGVALPRTWLSLMGSDLLPQVIIEHAPLDWSAPEGLMITTLGAFYFYTLIGAWRTERRITWLLPAVWFLLAWSRVRHGPIFAVMAALAIADMWRYHPFLSKRQPNLNPPTKAIERFPTVMAPIAVCTALAMCLQAFGLSCPILGTNRCRVLPPTWPTPALPSLAHLSQQQTKPVRVFNEMRWAGYLIYELPNVAVYIDDRCELHRDVGLQRYLELYSHPERLPGELDRYDIQAAIVSTGSPFAMQLSGMADWIVLYQDAQFALFAEKRVSGYHTAMNTNCVQVHKAAPLSSTMTERRPTPKTGSRRHSG